MAELTAFTYFPGTSRIHHLDIRFKLVVILVFNMISVRAGITELWFLSIPVLLSVFLVKMPVLKALSDTRYFIYFLIFIFLSRTLIWDETAILFIGYSYTDMMESLIICWRLFLIMIMGLVFMYTSRMLEIKAAIQWFLKPIPFIPEKKMGLMISLMIRFVPDILQQALEIKAAQKARCVDRRFRPVYRLVVFTIPLFQRIFELAENIVNAMLSRNYTEDRTDLELIAGIDDWVFTGIVVSYLLALLWGPFSL